MQDQMGQWLLWQKSLWTDDTEWYQGIPPLSSPSLDLDLQGKSVCVDSLCHFHKMEAQGTSVKDRPTSFYP